MASSFRNSGSVDPSVLVVSSFSVRGLSSTTKRCQLSDDHKRLKVSVCCLEETNSFDGRVGEYRLADPESESRHTLVGFGVAFDIGQCPTGSL